MKMGNVLLIVAMILVYLVLPSMAARQHVEAWYQRQWCEAHGGETEIVLEDGSRVDCLTASHAIEFDFADKWAESIGQAMNYAALTDKRGGIVLIGAPDGPGVTRIRNMIEVYRLPIDLWTVEE